MLVLLCVAGCVTAGTRRGRKTATKGYGWAKQGVAWGKTKYVRCKQRFLRRDGALELPLSGGGEEPEPPPAAEPDEQRPLSATPSGR